MRERKKEEKKITWSRASLRVACVAPVAVTRANVQLSLPINSHLIVALWLDAVVGAKATEVEGVVVCAATEEEQDASAAMVLAVFCCFVANWGMLEETSVMHGI